MTGQSDWRVAEVRLPAPNHSDVQAVCQFLSALPVPLSLEYFGTHRQRRLLMRAPLSALQQAAGRVMAHWPRARVQLLPADPTAGLYADPRAVQRS